MPSSMPARTAVDLCRGQLVVELPLQPAVKIDGVGVLGGEFGDRRAFRVREGLGPVMPVGAVLLGQRTPDGEVVEASPLPLAVRRVCQLPPGGTLDPVHAFQRGTLGFPGSVAVDELGLECACLRSSMRALRMRPRRRTSANSGIASTRR